jgi:hypothetical protein
MERRFVCPTAEAMGHASDSRAPRLKPWATHPTISEAKAYPSVVRRPVRGQAATFSNRNLVLVPSRRAPFFWRVAA